VQAACVAAYVKKYALPTQRAVVVWCGVLPLH